MHNNASFYTWNTRKAGGSSRGWRLKSMTKIKWRIKQASLKKIGTLLTA